MNCVISGSSGVAFILDGQRALLLRVQRPDVAVVVRPEEFHRIFTIKALIRWAKWKSRSKGRLGLWGPRR